MKHRYRVIRACVVGIAAPMFLLAGCAVADDPDTGPRDVMRIDAGEDVTNDLVQDDTPVDTVVDRDVEPDHMTGADVVMPVDEGTDTGPIDTGVDVPMVHDAGCAPLLVVNEVQVGSATSAADEFVEIHNSASCAVSLTGWSIRYAAVMGTTVAVKWTGVMGDSIPANGYVVIGGAAYTGASIGSLGTVGAFAAAGGGVGLYDSTATRIDSVGYGTTATNPMVEGTPVAAPATGQTIQRFPDGADTNNNASDFHSATATAGAVNH